MSLSKTICTYLWLSAMLALGCAVSLATRAYNPREIAISVALWFVLVALIPLVHLLLDRVFRSRRSC